MANNMKHQTIAEMAQNSTQEAVADKFGTSRQQVQRWIKSGALVIDGVVYLPFKPRK